MLKWILSSTDLILKVVIGMFTFWGFIWRYWLRKVWRKYYENYKANRDEWRIKLLSIQQQQNEMLVKNETKLNEINIKLSPNGGTSIFDNIEKVLDNQAILRSQTKASLFLDTTPTVKTNMKGECTFANLAYLRLCGFSSFEEARGTGGYRSIHSDDRERVRKEFSEVNHDTGIFICNYKKVNVLTGRVFKVTTMSTIIFDSKDVAIEIIGVITEDKN